MDPMSSMDKAKAYSELNKTHRGNGGGGKTGAALVATVLVGLASYGAVKKGGDLGDTGYALMAGWGIVVWLWYLAGKK